MMIFGDRTTLGASLAAIGFFLQAVSANQLVKDVEPRDGPHYAEYQTTETSLWVIPTLVPCPPIEWVNTKPTPVTQTKVVTQTLPDLTSYTTSRITRTISSHTIFTETDTYYTESTLTKSTTYTFWVTATVSTVNTSYTTETSTQTSQTIETATSTTTDVRHSVDRTTSTEIQVSQTVETATSSTTDVSTATSSTTATYEVTNTSVIASTSVISYTDLSSATLTYETTQTDVVGRTSILLLTDVSSSTLTYETTDIASSTSVLLSTDVSDLTVTKTVTSVQIETLTSVASLPECSSVGPFASLDSGQCGGDSCLVEYELGAFLEWTQAPEQHPVVTELVFTNPTVRARCTTTICNTEAFDRYYKTTATGCSLSPCPSNTVDCDCNFVVGPIRLPNGKTTSVTQTGPTGASLILGPSAVAHAIPTNDACGFAGCMTSTSTVLFTELGYSGSVSSTTFAGSERSSATNYFLPQLSSYFPTGNPLRSCTTVSLAIYTPEARPALVKRDVFAGPGPQIRFPGAPTLTETVPAAVTVESTSNPSSESEIESPSTTLPSPTTTSISSEPPPTTPTPDLSPEYSTTASSTDATTNSVPADDPEASTGPPLGTTPVTPETSVFASNGSVTLPSTWNYVCSAEGCTIVSDSTATAEQEAASSSTSNTTAAPPAEATTNDVGTLMPEPSHVMMIVLGSVIFTSIL